jgi:hypothetical protein
VRGEGRGADEKRNCKHRGAFIFFFTFLWQLNILKLEY